MPCALNSLLASFIIAFIFIILSSASPSFAFFHLFALLFTARLRQIEFEIASSNNKKNETTGSRNKKLKSIKS